MTRGRGRGDSGEIEIDGTSLRQALRDPNVDRNHHHRGEAGVTPLHEPLATGRGGRGEERLRATARTILNGIRRDPAVDAARARHEPRADRWYARVLTKAGYRVDRRIGRNGEVTTAAGTAQRSIDHATNPIGRPPEAIADG